MDINDATKKDLSQSSGVNVKSTQMMKGPADDPPRWKDDKNTVKKDVGKMSNQGPYGAEPSHM